MSAYDAVVVGAGPNGLAAAIELARGGCSVRVFEAAGEPGGGARSAFLTEPGFVHDLFSAVHPMAVASPFFRSLDLEAHGLEWVHSPAAVAHPMDQGPAAILEGNVARTADRLGADGAEYRRLLEPLERAWPELIPRLLAPVIRGSPPSLDVMRFGIAGLRSAVGLARRFEGAAARSLLAGNAAHSGMPLEHPATAAVAILLCLSGHTVGWPIPRGGAGAITAALVACLRTYGGEVETNREVRALEELPDARVVLLDVGPRQAASIARNALPTRFRSRLERFRYGPGAFKMDWALHGPIPWRDPACARAATVHVGGSLEEIAASEAAIWGGTVAERPFVILSQPTLFDPTRAPAGKHTAWAYGHVPNGYEGDVAERIESQIERFAPGFRDQILARRITGPAALEALNPNLVGGDVGGGAMDLGQLLFRPVPRLNPYATPVPGLFLCSASTPPGGGVHGMCGYHAARSALRIARRASTRP